jgi:ATP-dependent Clp protease adaptor protein ClpS
MVQVLKKRELMGKGVDLNHTNPSFSREEEDSEGESGVITQKKLARPKLYKVLLHNDDYTTMEFVIFILQKTFSKTFEEAQGVMLKVHNDGAGECGIYTFEIAESKVAKVLSLAKENGHPLMCTYEQE